MESNINWVTRCNEHEAIGWLLTIVFLMRRDEEID